MLLTSIFGSFLGFILLAAAEPVSGWLAGAPAGPAGADASSLRGVLAIGLLFISRLVDGLTGGNLSIAQVCITDVTDAKGRAQGLDLIGAAFGLGSSLARLRI